MHKRETIRDFTNIYEVSLDQIQTLSKWDMNAIIVLSNNCYCFLYPSIGR